MDQDVDLCVYEILFGQFPISLHGEDLLHILGCVKKTRSEERLDVSAAGFHVDVFNVQRQSRQKKCVILRICDQPALSFLHKSLREKSSSVFLNVYLKWKVIQNPAGTLCVLGVAQRNTVHVT